MGEEEDENDGIPWVVKIRIGEQLLLPSIYNSAVKNIVCERDRVCVCVCVYLCFCSITPRQTPCTLAAMTTPALRSGPRQCHLRQLAPWRQAHPQSLSLFN